MNEVLKAIHERRSTRGFNDVQLTEEQLQTLMDVALASPTARNTQMWHFSFVQNKEALAQFGAFMAEKIGKPDFCFLSMVETDEKGGHDSGWMTDTYMDYIRRAMDHVQRVVEAVDKEYTVIVTADHGGHDRTHGTELPEDMTIPMFFYGEQFAPGKALPNVSLLDLAPTIADLLGVPHAPEWEGKSLVK